MQRKLNIFTPKIENTAAAIIANTTIVGGGVVFVSTTDTAPTTKMNS